MLLRLAWKASALAAAGLTDKLARVVFFALIARRLSREDFGAYQLVLTLIFLFGLLATFGIGNVVIREVARRRESAGSIAGSALVIALASSALAWPLMAGLARLLHYPAPVVSLAGLAGVVFLFIAVGEISGAVLMAHQRMDLLALVNAGYALLGLGLAAAALALGGGLRALVAVLVASELLKAVALGLVVHRRVARLRPAFDRSLALPLLRQSLPFILLLGMGMLLRWVDLLILGWLRPLGEVAVYGAAVKVVEFLTLFSGSLVATLFPVFSSVLAASREEAWKLYKDSLALFGILGFGAAALLTVLPGPLLGLLFGGEDAAGAVPLRWLGWAFLFAVLSGPVGVLLLASGDQMGRLLGLGGLVLGLNLGLDLWLIPRYGPTGAAVATFSSTLLAFLGRVALARLVFGEIPPLGRIVWRFLPAGAAMAGVLALLGGRHPLALLAAGGLTYLALLALLGEFHQELYAPLRARLAVRRLWPAGRGGGSAR